MQISRSSAPTPGRGTSLFTPTVVRCQSLPLTHGVCAMGLKSSLVGVVNGIDPLRKWVSKRAINEYAHKTPPRPRPLSMASGYTTWPSLTDRRYSGRHLARIEGEKAPAHPDINKVVALFERPAGGFRKATDTSILFPFFAQWFTDSFLRTK